MYQQELGLGLILLAGDKRWFPKDCCSLQFSGTISWKKLQYTYSDISKQKCEVSNSAPSFPHLSSSYGVFVLDDLINSLSLEHLNNGSDQGYEKLPVYCPCHVNRGLFIDPHQYGS